MLRLQREEPEVEVRSGLTGLLSHDDRPTPSLPLRERGLQIGEAGTFLGPEVS
jgi:hypothetical protein